MIERHGLGHLGHAMSDVAEWLNNFEQLQPCRIYEPGHATEPTYWRRRLQSARTMRADQRSDRSDMMQRGVFEPGRP
jgi:hypothetical protein